MRAPSPTITSIAVALSTPRRRIGIASAVVAAHPYRCCRTDGLRFQRAHLMMIRRCDPTKHIYADFKTCSTGVEALLQSKLCASTWPIRNADASTTACTPFHRHRRIRVLTTSRPNIDTNGGEGVAGLRPRPRASRVLICEARRTLLSRTMHRSQVLCR